MATARRTIKPCDHCETKQEKRSERTIQGKKVFICDTCFVVLSGTKKTSQKSAAPVTQNKRVKLQWVQGEFQGNIVYRLEWQGVSYEVHNLVEWRHGRSRPPTKIYFLMLRPKIKEYVSLAEIEEEILSP